MCTSKHCSTQTHKTSQNASEGFSAPISQALSAEGSSVEARPLGSIAKSSSPCDVLTESLGTKKQNFDLQRTARKIYFEDAKEKGEMYPKHRTASCWYCSTANTQEGEHPSLILRADGSTGTAFVAKCKSVWTCPVCSRQIERIRREEISTAMNYFYKEVKGKQAAMVTFTFPHNKDQSLAEILKLQQAAFRRLRSGEAWSRFKDVFGFEGLIRGLETTFGFANGWHPHTHEIWFLDSSSVQKKKIKAIENYINARYRYKKLTARREEVLSLLHSGKKGIELAFHSMLTERWIDSCIAVGLAKDADIEDMKKRSIDTVFNASTGDYIAKSDRSKNWGADSEIASSKSKRSLNKERFHPFDFLVQYQETGEFRWRKLFMEYSNAFKGKRHIYWSPGLKERVGLIDIDDEELDLDPVDESEDMIFPIKEFPRFRSAPTRAIIALSTIFQNKMTQEEGQEWLDDAISSIPERRWCDTQEDFTHEDEAKWKDAFKRKKDDLYRRDVLLMYLNEQYEES